MQQGSTLTSQVREQGVNTSVEASLQRYLNHWVEIALAQQRVFTANDTFPCSLEYIYQSVFPLICDAISGSPAGVSGLQIDRLFQVQSQNNYIQVDTTQTQRVAQPHGPGQREHRQRQHKCSSNKAAGRFGRYRHSDTLESSQRVHEPNSSSHNSNLSQPQKTDLLRSQITLSSLTKQDQPKITY